MPIVESRGLSPCHPLKKGGAMIVFGAKRPNLSKGPAMKTKDKPQQESPQQAASEQTVLADHENQQLPPSDFELSAHQAYERAMWEQFNPGEPYPDDVSEGEQKG